MDREELADLIRTRMENEVRWNDLVMEVSELGDMNWDETVAFIHQIEYRHGGRIRSRRRWWLLVLGVGLATGGGVIAGYAAIILAMALGYLLQMFELRQALDIYILSGGYLPVPFFLIFLGVVMIVIGVVCLFLSRPPGMGQEGQNDQRQ